MPSIILGGGCFWCLEAVYQLIDGVEDVVSGYAGGTLTNPTYQSVSTGRTGHAEVVKVTYNDSVISLEEIMDIFWNIHDPTTVDRQGADVGSQYRSIIIVSSGEQRDIVETTMAHASLFWDKPIVTEIIDSAVFYPAEDEHQDYFVSHPDQAYCSLVIAPKLEKVRHSLQLAAK